MFDLGAQGMAADAGALEKSARAALPVRRLGCLGLALVALFVLSPAAHAQIPPGCVSSAGDTVLTCSGNRQTGVELDATGTTYTTLNVINLTTDIAPPPSDVGVFFFSPGVVNLNIGPGPFAIFTTDADGVLAAGDTSVTLDSSIAITTSGDGAVGIRVGGQNDPVIVVSRGMIVTDGLAASGILVGATDSDIDIQSFGSIATQGEDANGIDVANSGGAINIRSEGNIATEGVNAFGIYATSGSGAITIRFVRQHRHRRSRRRGHQRVFRRQCHHQFVRQHRHRRSRRGSHQRLVGGRRHHQLVRQYRHRRRLCGRHLCRC